MKTVRGEQSNPFVPGCCRKKGMRMEYKIELAGIPIRLETKNAMEGCVFEDFRTEKPAKATAVSGAEQIERWKAGLAEGTPEWFAE